MKELNLEKFGLKEKKYNQFLKTLKLAVNKKILIIIKGYPDPDSIGASLAFKFIASNLYNIECTILHFDKIGYEKNNILIKSLNISLIEYSSKFNFSEYDYMVFNDTQSVELPINIKTFPQPLILIDHHKNLNPKNVIYTDIRENAGSTCSIYTEYLSQIGDFRKYLESKEFISVATALMHGIRIDTDDFLLATSIDYKAASWLFHYVDNHLLSLVSNYTISIKTMDMKYKALKNKEIRGSYLFSGIKFVNTEDRDSIAIIADYLLRLERIELVVIYAVVNGKYIEGSVRAKDRNFDIDKWIKDIFGFNPYHNNNPYGGGRLTKGGFKLPLGIFSECSNKSLLWKFIKTTIMDIFIKKLNI